MERFSERNSNRLVWFSNNLVWYLWHNHVILYSFLLKTFLQVVFLICIIFFDLCMLLNKFHKKWNQEFWGFFSLQIQEKTITAFFVVRSHAIKHVINFPQKLSKSMLSVIAVHNLTQKEQQRTIYVKVAMVTTITWKSGVSQCKWNSCFLYYFCIDRSRK